MRAGVKEAEQGFRGSGEPLPLQFEQEFSVGLNYCIALQPICDASMHHVADELLYRASSDAEIAQFDDAQTATARACNVAFYESSVQELVGDRHIFVNMPDEWLLKPELLPPHPDQLVIEVLESVSVTPEILSALHRIRNMGYQIALDDFVLTEHTRPLLATASIIKVDIANGLDEAALDIYRQRGIRLLAEKVESLSSFRHMQTLGFEFFQGYFYARPETHRATAHQRTSNRGVLFGLLAEMQRSDIDYRDLERKIMQDPQLVYQLLRYANSALYQLHRQVTSIRDCLAMLGLAQVRIIVITILLSNHGPACRLLLGQALTRAAMCERLAEQGHEDPDAGFTVGLMSMMGVLLGESLPELMAQLPIPQFLVECILGHRHALGRLLRDVDDFENSRVGSWTASKIDDFNRAWLDSRVWATRTLAMIDQA